MGRNPLILTDDKLTDVAFQIHEWIVRTPLAHTDEGYDHLKDLVFSLLEDYSNGYVNYN